MLLTELLGSASGIIVALCLLFLCLFWPVILLCAAFSVVRSLRRIAAAMEQSADDRARKPAQQKTCYPNTHEETGHRVANSMFAR